MREALTKKKKYKLPGEIVRVEDVKTDQGTIQVPVSFEKPKRSHKETANHIIKKYNKIRKRPTAKKKNENISILEEIKNANNKKKRENNSSKDLKRKVKNENTKKNIPHR